MRILHAGAVALAVIVCGAANTPAVNLTSKEKMMLQSDVSGGAYEQQLSAMALKKSSNSQIKAFADTDIQDHAALIKQAKQIAGQSQDEPQVEPTPQDKAKLATLDKQSGHAFDDAFVKAMGAVNEEDKKSFAADEKDATSPEVKQYLQRSHDIDTKHENLLKAIHVGY